MDLTGVLFDGSPMEGPLTFKGESLVSKTTGWWRWKKTRIYLSNNVRISYEHHTSWDDYGEDGYVFNLQRKKKHGWESLCFTDGKNQDSFEGVVLYLIAVANKIQYKFHLPH